MKEIKVKEYSYTKEVFKNRLTEAYKLFKQRDFEKNKKRKYREELYSDILCFFPAATDDISDFFSFSSFQNWKSGQSVPPATYIPYFCEAFGCDANFLFSSDEDLVTDSNGDIIPNTVEAYIYKTYGLNKRTLDILKEYKDKQICEEPLNNKSEETTFSYLLNDLLEKKLWLLLNIGQILCAYRHNLSTYGFATPNNSSPLYTDYKYTDYIYEEFDLTKALALLSIKLQETISKTEYVPNKEETFSCYDKDLTPDKIYNYILHSMSYSFDKLEDENEYLKSKLRDTNEDDYYMQE